MGLCSGEIELPEMIEIIGTLYEMEGVSKVVIKELSKRTVLQITKACL